MNLNQLPFKQLELSVLPTEDGWRIQSSGAESNISSYSLVCEALAGRPLAKPIPLTHLLNTAGNSAEISYTALEALSDKPVDAYSHPVFALLANDSQGAGARSSLRAASRPVPMSVTANFRDYGGHVTQAGRQVVWAKLFRTGHMGEMSAADQQALLHLNIQAVCDFRRLEEAANQPSQLPDGLEPTSIVISPGSSIDLFTAIMADGIDEATIDAFMEDINRDLVVNHQASYRQMFDELLEHGNSGSIIHCSAGKDRTGFGGLLVLGALGVDRETIMEDYLLTNRYVNIDREIARWTKNYGSSEELAETGQENAGSGRGAFNRDALAVILKVKASYLQAAIDTIDDQFGGLDSYLREQIGLRAEELTALENYYLY